MITTEEKGVSSLFNIQDLPPRYAIAFACQAVRRILPLLEKNIGEYGEAALSHMERIAGGEQLTPTAGVRSADSAGSGGFFQAIASAVKSLTGSEASQAPTAEATSIYESAQYVMNYLNKLISGANPDTQTNIMGVLREIYDTLMRHYDITGQDTVDSSIFSSHE